MLKKNKFIRTTLWLILILLLTGTATAQPSLGPAMGDVALSTAPTNPAFLDYMKSREKGELMLFTDDNYPLGYIPPPVERYRKTPDHSEIEITDTLPEAFDLRVTGRITPVRDQDPYGSCWTFATYGSLESYLRSGETPDFSENNMMHLHGFDWGPNDGGNEFISMAYLARWSGPVEESDDPYGSAKSPGLSPVKHVQKVEFIPNNPNLIKEALMVNGALFTKMRWDPSLFKSSNNAYYNYVPYEESDSATWPNHGVTIVGWDNNYPSNNFNAPQPSGSGAWIIKNSWGTGWGESGYFYLSYFDTYAGYDVTAFHNAEATNNYSRVYQYDPLGWLGSIGTGSDTLHGANIFSAAASENLAAVSFYAVVPNTEYEIKIYTDVSAGQPTSGFLQLTQIGTLASDGYHTIPLDNTVSLNAGQHFSVVIKFTTPDWNFPGPFEDAIPGYSSEASANPGESFYSTDSNSWYDLTDNFPNANFCIKAFTETSEKPGDDGTIEGNIVVWDGVLSYISDFEANNGGFAAKSFWGPNTWAWGTPTNPPGSYSPTKVWGTNLTGNYSNDTFSFLVSPVISLMNMENARAEFYHWYEFEDDYDFGDFWVIDPKTGDLWYDSGWTGDTVTGSKLYWSKQTFSLDAFIWMGWDQIQLAFSIDTDESVTMRGWYIDDLVVLSQYTYNPTLSVLESGLVCMERPEQMLDRRSVLPGKVEKEKEQASVESMKLDFDKIKKELQCFSNSYTPVRSDKNTLLAAPLSGYAGVLQTSLGAAADAGGDYSFSHPPTPSGARYNLQAEAAGTYNRTEVFQLGSGETATQNFGLFPIQKVNRISGTSRYLTALEISYRGWQTADTVLLARGDNYADALAGVPLAYQLDAPILLTRSDQLTAETSNQIIGLNARKVIILGGSAAVSEAVENTLETLGLQVQRIEGKNRFATAAAIAERLALERGSSADTAVIAYSHNFPDALSAASYAAIYGYPILLANTNELSNTTSAALYHLGIKNTIVVGGTGVISDTVLSQLPNPTRVSGADRYTTGVALANYFNLPVKHYFIATGLNFPDAITGAALAAKNNSGVLLVRDKSVPPVVNNYINSKGVEQVTIFGGYGAVSRDVSNHFHTNLP